MLINEYFIELNPKNKKTTQSFILEKKIENKVTVIQCELDFNHRNEL